MMLLFKSQQDKNWNIVNVIDLGIAGTFETLSMCKKARRRGSQVPERNE
jgi:hypothetical protein